MYYVGLELGFRSVAKVVHTVKYSFLYSEGDLREKYHETAALRSYGVKTSFGLPIRSSSPYEMQTPYGTRMKKTMPKNGSH